MNLLWAVVTAAEPFLRYVQLMDTPSHSCSWSIEHVQAIKAIAGFVIDFASDPVRIY
jgi:hypothetical protein